MSANISEILGLPYESLLEAQVDKSPSEVVITNDGGQTYYIVDRSVYDSELSTLDYEIVVADGE